MAKLKLAVIVGSNRTGSINQKLARAMIELIGDRADTHMIKIDDLPIYNQDHEGNRPDVVNRFTREVAACDAVLMVTPEHNRSITAVLKNAIDWGSKPADKNVWKGKAIAMTGTSPGAIGTAVAQQHLRQVMGILGALVMGGEAYIAFKAELIGDDGSIAIEDTKAFLQSYLDNFLNTAEKLAV